MLSEPHKIKTVRRPRFTSLNERKKELRAAFRNTFRIPSDRVTFDMTSQGSGAMSHDQLAGILIGDEAYAGSRNFQILEDNAKKVLGHSRICPTHNLRGSVKLISTTMVSRGDKILSNSLTPKELSEDRNATLRCIARKNALCDRVLSRGSEAVPCPEGRDPWSTRGAAGPHCLRENAASKSGGEAAFSGDVDLDLLRDELGGGKKVPYVYVETFADGYRPVSLANLKEIRKIAEEQSRKSGAQRADSRKTLLILDASRAVENAVFIRENEPGQENKSIAAIVQEMVKTSHVCILDAGQDARCNVGGLISTDDVKLYEQFQNEVVIYEGLHTYGGMAGRTMEIFARGLEEMADENQAMWITEQVKHLVRELVDIPLIPGCDGAYLKAHEFLPKVRSHQAHALAAALYLKSGVRAFLEGRFAEENILPLQIPRLTLNNRQISQIAQAVKELYGERDKITGFRLSNRPKWHDEANFDWKFPNLEEYSFDCEPHVIHTIEYVGVTSREERERAIEEAGYNTFLLLSKDVTIDLLTDSGTSAMSVEQWQKYDGGVETPASSKDYFEFVRTVRELTGYTHVVPTHQGRAAEHIMSQIMIGGGYVPGNMYFTTTKLHQELAGGKFADVIVDEAHDPASTFQWKGNINIKKLDSLVKKTGPKSFPYISFEMSVNMAGGQPFSMDNARDLYAYCRKHRVPVMFDATRAVENAYMIKKRDPRYRDVSIKDILKKMFSYGDGCTWSSKKDPLVNIGGLLAFRNDDNLYTKALEMLRKYEGPVTNGGMSAGDMASQAQGLREMVDERHIRARVEQVQYLGKKLLEAGIPIVKPPGSHAIFLDAKRFLPDLDQDEFPAQALAAAIFVECGVRAMERGNVSKGRNPETGENYRPALELVRLTIPRRVYTNSHMDTVAEGIIAVYKRRKAIKGLRFTYEPRVLRFFQGRFEEINP